jgi:hypothetical protein
MKLPKSTEQKNFEKLAAQENGESDSEASIDQ